ncbi:MAG: flagellar biosynthesis protein FlhB [Spirochaetes bacterium]|jgi:flagellar biosynthetic protein FlhB|nr:flagellar biosynthesis protein FlhB [Spirochaetota bacterium]
MRDIIKLNESLNPPEKDLRLFRFDLQLFAAEDEGRTEEPTEKKLREAREKGQVAKTEELSQAIVIMFCFMVMFFLGVWLYHIMARMTAYYMSTFSGFSITERSLLREFTRLTIECSKILLPIFAAAILAALIGNIAQVGFQISTHPLKLDWNKIKFDPATIFKKVFFSKQIGMNLFKSIFKVVAIALVAYLIIINDYDIIIKSADISVALAMKSVSIIALKIVLWASVIILVLAIPDYLFQKRQFVDSLKMTKEEIKEELKETIGDPYIRARLREMQREIVMRNMIRDVPRADVVVTNPTHFAVALQYDSIVMEAPKVIAKGADAIALRIIGIARENNIFVIENRPLAQEMYFKLEVGDIIPEGLFYAVSLVYAELYKRKGLKKAI